MSEKDFLLTPSSEEEKTVAVDETATAKIKEVEVKEAKETVVREAFLIDDTVEKASPVVEEAPVVVESPVVEDTPVVVESPVVEEAPVVVESPVVEEAPVVVESPVVEEAPVVVESPVVEEKPEELSYQRRAFDTDGIDADKEKFQRKGGKKEKQRKKLRTYQQRQNRLGYAFMTPWIIGFLIFTLFPFIATIFLSFTSVVSGAYGFEFTFVGVDNYVAALVRNGNYTPALLSYIQSIVPYTCIVVVISFIIAYLLNMISTGKGLLRTIYFLPVIIMSGPVMNQITEVDEAAQMAAAMSGGTVQSDYSNIFIMQIVESYSPQLSAALGSIFDQLSLILWFTGIPIVLFINALQKINVSIYEAAKIDSANSWQIMWKITIPMLKSIGMIISIFTVVQLGMYEVINPVYKLIQEQTQNRTDGLGFAATFSWIYSFVVLIFIGIICLLFREKKGKRGA